MKRLDKISELVDGKYLCDVGTDHGYLPLICFKKGLIERAFLIDNKKMPLESARNNLHQYINKCSFSLSNGLDEVDLNVDVISICGLGSELIIKILDKKKEYLDNKKIILCANKDYFLLRKWLYNNNFEIINESLIFDKFYYEAIVVKKTNKKIFYTEEELRFGVKLIHDEENYDYFLHLKKRFEKIKDLNEEANKNYIILEKILNDYKNNN